MDRGFGDARRLDELGRQGRQPGQRQLVDLDRHAFRSGVHLFAQVVGRHVADELAALFGVALGVLAWVRSPAMARGEHDHWRVGGRSEEHTSELQSLMRISYAVFCLKKQKKY